MWIFMVFVLFFRLFVLYCFFVYCFLSLFAQPSFPYKVGHMATSSNLRYFPTGFPQVIQPSNLGTRSIKEFLGCWRSISKQNALILKFSGSFLCAGVYFWSLRPYGVCSPIKSSKAISTDLRMDIKRT